MTTIELIDEIFGGYDKDTIDINRRIYIVRRVFASQDGFAGYYQVYTMTGILRWAKENIAFAATRVYSVSRDISAAKVIKEIDDDTERKLKEYLNGKSRERDASGADSDYPSRSVEQNLV